MRKIPASAVFTNHPSVLMSYRKSIQHTQATQATQLLTALINTNGSILYDNEAIKLTGISKGDLPAIKEILRATNAAKLCSDLFPQGYPDLHQIDTSEWALHNGVIEQYCRQQYRNARKIAHDARNAQYHLPLTIISIIISIAALILSIISISK